MTERRRIAEQRRELMPWLGPIQAHNVRIVASELRHLNDVEIDGSTKDVLTQMGWHHLRTFHTELFGKSQSFEVFEGFGDGWDREAYPNCTKYRSWDDPGIVITAPDHNSSFATNVYTSDESVLEQFLPGYISAVTNVDQDDNDVIYQTKKEPETNRISRRPVRVGGGYRGW